MDRFIYFAAILASIAQIGLAVYLFAESRGGSDSFLALLLLLPPAISLIALHFSPDFEERRLTRKLRKAQLRRELKEMGE